MCKRRQFMEKPHQIWGQNFTDFISGWRIQIGHGGLNWRWGQELYSGNNQSQVHSDGGETEESKTMCRYSFPCLQYSCHLYREGCLSTFFTGFKWQNLHLSSLCLEPKKSSLTKRRAESEIEVAKPMAWFYILPFPKLTKWKENSSWLYGIFLN